MRIHRQRGHAKERSGEIGWRWRGRWVTDTLESSAALAVEMTAPSKRQPHCPSPSLTPHPLLLLVTTPFSLIPTVCDATPKLKQSDRAFVGVHARRARLLRRPGFCPLHLCSTYAPPPSLSPPFAPA